MIDIPWHWIISSLTQTPTWGRAPSRPGCRPRSWPWSPACQAWQPLRPLSCRLCPFWRWKSYSYGKGLITKSYGYLGAIQYNFQFSYCAVFVSFSLTFITLVIADNVNVLTWKCRKLSVSVTFKNLLFPGGQGRGNGTAWKKKCLVFLLVVEVTRVVLSS